MVSALDMSNLIAVLVDLAKIDYNYTLNFNAIELTRKAICTDAYMMKSQIMVNYGRANSIEMLKI